MDSSIPYNDDEMIESQLSTTQALETAYKDTVRNGELIVKDEGARRLRLRILMLETENDDLHEQLGLGDDRIDILEQECGELREESARAQEDVFRQEADLRTQSRELANLKAELASMNGITTDSTRILTEKLSLSRELAVLKPELEHLRSQAPFQQTVLAEKLSLQRQVATLEVELETEKRAAKRAADKIVNNEKLADLQGQIDKLEKELAKEKRERAKSRKNAEIEAELQAKVEKLENDLAHEKRERMKSRKENDSELQSQIDTLQSDLSREKRERTKERKDLEAQLEAQVEDSQKDLARERKEREKIQKETAKEFKTSEAQRTILESKMDQMRTKLLSTKEQLKQSQAELNSARNLAAKSHAGAKKEAAVSNPRKRNAQQISDELNIGTPDGVAVRGKRAGGKRAKLDQTLVGEKSMFSITPFLNRTTNIALDTPKERDEQSASPDPISATKDIEAMDTEAREQSPSVPAPPPGLKPKGRKKKANPETAKGSDVLGEAKTSKVNRKPAPKRIAEPSKLEMVAEEEEANENEAIHNPTRTESKKEAPPSGKPVPPKMIFKGADVEDPQPKMKKRKLLGSGKTLFDDDDGEAARRPAKMTLGPARLLGKGGFGVMKSAANASFGAFSPLKKDKRGVGASFLA